MSFDATQAGDAAFARRAPGWPLLATLGVHLLLAWSWRAVQPPAEDRRAERFIELLPVPPPAPAPALRLPPPPPLSRAVPAPRARADHALTQNEREPVPVTPPPEAPASAADPFAISAPDMPPESALDAMVGRARREAGPIDKAARKGKPGVPAVADTPWGRFTRALEAAHVGSSRTLTTDTYAAPDGQVIYRFRQGGKSWCRTTGGVAPRIGGAEGGGATLHDVQGGEGRAGQIRCPSHGDWKRD